MPRAVDFGCSLKMGKAVVTHENGVRAHGATSIDEPSRRWALPPEVRRLLIVGAGGFGREVLNWARDAWPHACDRIAGFLSEDRAILDGFDCGIPIVETPEHYQPVAGDRLLLAIGAPDARRRVAEALSSRGSEFLTLVHPTAIIASSACIGHGSIICPYAIVSDACRVGRFAIMNYHTALGHDASTGDFAVLSPYATLGGAARIEDDVFLGLHASIGPGKTVGRNSKVSANTCVLMNVPPRSLAFGVPGRIVNRIEGG